MQKKITIIIVGLLFLIGGGFMLGKFLPEKETFEASANANLRNGLVAFYKFDETGWTGVSNEVIDSSGRGNYGCAYNGADTAAIAKFGRSGEFDTTNYVRIANSDTLDITGEITLSAWIYPLSDVVGGSIIKKPWVSNVNPWRTYQIYRSSSNASSFCITNSSNVSVCANASASTPLNTWSLVTGTYDGSKVKFYTNGIFDHEAIQTGSIKSNSEDVYIGFNSNYTPQSFDGYIDDVRIYNRALSASEVATLAGSYKVESITKNDLVGHWSMDANDISGITVYDKSGYDSNGTKSGSSGGNNTPALYRGQIKEALDFDGTDDRVSIAENSNLYISGDITLSLWLNADSFVDYARMIMMSNFSENESDNILYMLNTFSTGDLYIGHEYGAGINQIYIINTNLKTNQWYNVSLVRSAAQKKYYFYINGAYFSEQAYDFNPTGGSTSDLKFGGENYWYNGRLDDIRIYNYALSAQEIAALYNSAKENHITSAPKTGLVGWWTMDNNNIFGARVYDSSGSNTHGTMIGTTTSTGQIGQARIFDGTDDNIVFTSYPTGDIISFGAWAKTSQLGYQTLIDNQYAGALNPGINIFINTASNFPICRFDDGVVNPTAYDDTMNIVDGQWHHIFCTKDASDNKKIYVDGVLKKTDTTAMGDMSSSDNMYIGSYNGTTGGPWNGSVDDVRIYDRVLSAIEVMQLYEATGKTYVR
ncbi:MAG: hypothetical protein COU51_01565 [Parcubacteria group bacterium CG10_big_fil_rev_8_21_14_0_10_36_14]|nr:MAG: hypothetical protein COU51_01565 [Parcubacteria group bacterium CG10_big_fil_rev_8_21_14_0_10_36_14]